MTQEPRLDAAPDPGNWTKASVTLITRGDERLSEACFGGASFSTEVLQDRRVVHVQGDATTPAMASSLVKHPGTPGEKELRVAIYGDANFRPEIRRYRVVETLRSDAEGSRYRLQFVVQGLHGEG